MIFRCMDNRVCAAVTLATVRSRCPLGRPGPSNEETLTLQNMELAVAAQQLNEDLARHVGVAKKLTGRLAAGFQLF
jgi:hypothetical protein